MRLRTVCLLCLLVSSTGSGQKQQQAAAPQAPAIPVSEIVERDMRDFVDFTGRMQAVQLLSVARSAETGGQQHESNGRCRRSSKEEVADKRIMPDRTAADSKPLI